MDIQEKFLQKLIKQKIPVAVYLKNGIKLLGILTDTCEEVLFLQAGTKVMIYKKAINTILPASIDEPA